MKQMTQEDLAKALPANLKSSATQELADQINQVVRDPIVAEQVRNNFVSYAAVLKEGRFKTGDYLNAVVYVSYKLMGLSNQEAYEYTFPTRYANLQQKGFTDKDISAYVAAYHKGKLVNLIMEQVLTPAWILNQEVFQKAINVQADLMMHANSEKVRSDAANSILTHLAKPKEAAPLISIDINETDGVREMKNLMGQMARQQQELIKSGVGTKSIAEQRLIEGEYTEVDEEEESENGS